MAGANMRLNGVTKLWSPLLVSIRPLEATMKKTLLMTAGLLVICAGLASAAGLNLGWDNCAGLGAGAVNKNFACNTNTGIPSTMVGSFVAPAGSTLFGCGVDGANHMAAEAKR